MARAWNWLYASRRWKTAVRPMILERDGYRCKQCGRAAGRLEVDHVRPLHQGGAVWEPDNLQVLCGGANGCHARKTRAENEARFYESLSPARRGWKDLVNELRT